MLSFRQIAALLSPFALLFSACTGAAAPRAAAPSPTNAPDAVTPTPEPVMEFYVSPDGSDQNPGSLEQPWATPNYAARRVQAGQTVYFRAGTYPVKKQVRVQNAGTPEAWITFAAYPGEEPVFDFIDTPVGPPGSASPSPHDQGAFQIEGVAYIRVRGLTIRNSHNAGIMVRDSSHVDILNNFTDTTFSPGIAAWDTNTDGKGTEYIRVMGNRVTRANTHAMIISGFPPEQEAPHEAISIAGAQHFEVSYNHLFKSDKEGIDVKEVSKHGKVHHNLVEGMDRQGIYVDAWFGAIEDIEIYDNVMRNCHGAGLAFSTENGEEVSDVWAHHNLIYNNLGTGIFFSRWGGDGPRRNVKITNNTVYHNGAGFPASGMRFFWITGGMFIYSPNLKDFEIRDNIFAENAAFQVGYSELWLKAGTDGEAALRDAGIVIDHNIIYEQRAEKYPVRVGWPPEDYTNAWATMGKNPIQADPLFKDPAGGDFTLQAGSPAEGMGAFPAPEGEGPGNDFWWLKDFPPEIKDLP